MQKEQIDRFVTLASLQMPALVSQPLFQGAEIFEDYAMLTFRLPKTFWMEELLDELEDQMDWCFYTITCQVPIPRSVTDAAPIPTHDSATCTS